MAVMLLEFLVGLFPFVIVKGIERDLSILYCPVSGSKKANKISGIL